MEDHEIALNKAKIALMSKPSSSFFTTLCFSLKHIWDTTIPTSCTDGAEVLYNPTFFMGLTPEERVFLLIHETMHVAYLHMDRLETRDMRRFNIAGDHVINLMLVERGFKMPPGGLCDSQYTGMGTEEVYNLLPEGLPPPPMDDLRPSKLPSDELVERVQDMVVRASIQSKIDGDSQGTIPGDIQVFLNKLLSPKLPWNRILQKFTNALAKNDYTYRKPNRRYFPTFYLPTLQGEKLQNIEVAVDVSGSVSQAEFDRVITEVYSILKTMKPEKLSVVHFDTYVRDVNVVKNTGDLMNVKFTGRGGTDIGPLLERAEETKPKLLLVFTDGHFRFNTEPYKGNLVWLIHGNPAFTAPFGKVIHYEI